MSIRRPDILVTSSSVLLPPPREHKAMTLDVIRRAKNGLTVNAPGDGSLVPSGWYMLFATDRNDIPSHAAWVRAR